MGHRLRQVIPNPADNAAKYNQRDGHVTLSLRRDGEHAIITLANAGPGIPPEQLPRVFDRFFRTDAAHEDRQDVCSLGLSIAQWIVTAHGGKIEHSSQPNGHNDCDGQAASESTGFCRNKRAEFRMNANSEPT